MRIVGFVAVSLVGLGIITGIVVGLISIPDIKRYLRIRSM
jgi:hypothetical protein